MSVKFIEEKCTICSQCIVVCPEEAIKGWEFPVIDREKCNDCKRCVVYCPTCALVWEEE
jgi:Pyruvate/2-oxoacid:ferredoxin oxidoreductase delta subunit